MTSTSELAAGAQRGPGRPSSGAADRILEAAYEVLKRDGYAGLTNAKVAAASGQNKALIGYYFGSKQGLVSEVARHVSAALTDEVLGGLGQPRSAAELVERLAEGVWRAMDRDEGLQRVYFDLASQSIVDPKVGAIMLEMKEGHRAVLRELLRDLPDGPPPRELDGVVVFLVAGLEGLSLERLERGETKALQRAMAHWIDAAGAVISSR